MAAAVAMSTPKAMPGRSLRALPAAFALQPACSCTGLQPALSCAVWCTEIIWHCTIGAVHMWRRVEKPMLSPRRRGLGYLRHILMRCCQQSRPTQHVPLQTNVVDSWKEQLYRLQSDLAQARGQLQQQRLLTAQLQAQADAAEASLAEAEGQPRVALAAAAAQADKRTLSWPTAQRC